MKAKNILVIICLLWPVWQAAGQARQSQWSDAMYRQHNWQSFFELPAANQHMQTGKVDVPLLNAAIFYESNRHRQAKRLQPFVHSAALERAATDHSTDMVRLNFFNHRSKIRKKRTPAQRMKAAGIDAAGTAENIAMDALLDMKPGKAYYPPSSNNGQFSYSVNGKPLQWHTYASFARRVVQGWMDSPGHRANLLHTKLKYLGCGVWPDKQKNQDDPVNVRATQNFASHDVGESW